MRLIDELAQLAYDAWRRETYSDQHFGQLSHSQQVGWLAAVEAAVLSYLKTARTQQERFNETVGFYRLREDAATIPAQRAGSSVERVVDGPEGELVQPSALQRISVPEPGEG